MVESSIASTVEEAITLALASMSMRFKAGSMSEVSLNGTVGFSLSPLWMRWKTMINLFLSAWLRVNEEM